MMIAETRARVYGRTSSHSPHTQTAAVCIPNHQTSSSAAVGECSGRRSSDQLTRTLYSLQSDMSECSSVEIDISPDNDGSVVKKILIEGHGFERPSDGNEVEVHYTGRLVDGTVFDSSVTRGEKFKFRLGNGSVIKGWEVGVASMRRGEKAELRLKPEFAYGATGSPPNIPPHATLIFEIQLFDWRMEDLTKKQDGGVQRSILVNGSGHSTPNEGATVAVRLIGKSGDRVFDERDVSFVVGEAAEADVILGIDMAVTRMKKGETSKLLIRKDYAWSDLPPRQFDLVPGADVTYEVTLNDFDRQKETWQMNEEEKVEQAEFSKNRGSDFFRKGKYALALKQYKRVKQIISPFDAKKDMDEKKYALLLAAHLNLAMTYLKLEKPSAAITSCDQALEMDPNNEKALFRRALANIAIKEYPAAQEGFEKVLSLNPNNAAAAVELSRTQKAIREHRNREKQIFSGMFDRFAKHDENLARMRATNVWKELGDEEKRDFQTQEQNNE